MFDLKGKTALVTGSSQGIGKEIAKALAKSGAKVYAHGLTLTDKLQKAAEYIGAFGIATGDISNAETPKSLYEQTGGVDILVLNASVQEKKDWDAFSEEDFDWHFNCNVKSSYFMVKQYVPYMKDKKWGRIVTIGSVNQYNNHPQLALYGMTKAAQMKMVQNIAPFIAPYGITINNIAPGAINTPRNEKALSDEEFKRKVIASIPTGYVGDAKDMNGAIMLLCSDAGRYITGSDIVVDGGMRL